MQTQRCASAKSPPSSPRHTLTGCIVTLGLGLLAAVPLQAADTTWNNTGINYNAGASWGGTAPGNGDAAVFAAVAATQPNVTADITNQQVRFSVAAASGYTLSANMGAELTLTSTGTGATAGTGSALVGANTSGINTITAPIILGAATGSTQTFRASGAGGTTIVSGDVSELNSGIKLRVEGSTTGILRLSGNNSFSGGLLLNSGILEIGSGTAMPNTGTLTLAGGALRSSDDTLRTFTNPLDLSGTVYFGSDTASQNGAIRFTGPVTMTGNVVTKAFGGSYLTASVAVFEGAIGESGSRTLSVAGSTSGGSLGYLFLLGANTYTGPTEISLPASSSSDIVVINTIGNAGETASSLGAPVGATDRTLKFGGRTGTLRYIGGQTTTDRDITTGVNTVSQGGTSTLDASGSGSIGFAGTMMWEPTVTAARTLALTGTSPDDNTFAGVISAAAAGSIAVAKSGTGTWGLSGANSFAGGLTVNSGKLLLDYVTNPTVVNSANSLTLGGGTLQLQAKSVTASAQTLGNLTLTTNTQSRIELLPNGVGGTMALTLGDTWTRGSTAAAYFGLPVGTALTSSPTLTNLLLQYAVVQDASDIGFATTSAGNVVRYTYVPSEQLTASPPFSNTANLYHTGSLTMTGGSTLGYTLAIDTTGGGTLDLGAGTRSINTAGSVLFHGSGGYTIANGTFNANSSSGDLIFHQYADGVVTLSATWGSANNYLSKSGPGTLVISNKGGAGALRIYEGALRADDASVLTYYNSAARYIILNGGVLELGAAGDCTNSIGAAQGTIQFLGDGGFSAYGATRAVQLNNGTASIDWGSANFVPANNALMLSGKDANALIDFQNGLGFGNQQRVVRVNDGSADVDARLSGVLSGQYGGGLIKEGAGTLEITGNSNSYIGETWVKAGTLLVNNTSGSGTGSGPVTVTGGATLGGSGAITGDTTVDGSIAPGNSIGILTIANNVTWNAGDAWVFELGAAGLSLASPGSSDLLNIAGSGSDLLKGSGSGWTFDFVGTGTDGWYKLVDWAGTTTFVAADFTATNLAAGRTGLFTIDPPTSALYLQVIPAGIPEPASALLVAAAAVVAGLARRRRV